MSSFTGLDPALFRTAAFFTFVFAIALSPIYTARIYPKEEAQ
jgi:hypothetical protein